MENIKEEKENLADNDCYSVYAKYGEWELVDSGIAKQTHAISWASEVSRKDEVATRVKYKDEIIWKSIYK